MRYLFISSILAFNLYAIDYSNMFLTNERENPYSSLSEEEEEAAKKKKKSSPITNGKKKSLTSTKDTNTVYQMQFGFESEDPYDDRGYGLVFSIIKPKPNWSETNPNYFIQGDLLYSIKDLKHTATGATKDYLALTGYIGYKYEWSDKTWLTPKIGYSFITGDNEFEMAYGIGITRKLLNPQYRLIAGWVNIGDMTLLSFGAEF